MHYVTLLLFFLLVQLKQTSISHLRRLPLALLLRLELCAADHLHEVNNEHFLHQQVAQILHVIQHKFSLGSVREICTICWRWARVIDFGRPVFGRVARSPSSSSVFIHLASVVRWIPKFSLIELMDCPIWCMPIIFPLHAKNSFLLGLLLCQTLSFLILL